MKIDIRGKIKKSFKNVTMPPEKSTSQNMVEKK
jgi:hypothetical protein